MELRETHTNSSDDTQLSPEEIAQERLEGINDEIEQRIKSEFDADDNNVRWLIKIHQVNGSTRSGKGEDYLFSCDPSEMPIIDRIRDRYGSGVYRVRVWRNGRLHNQWDYSIKAPADWKPPAIIPESVTQVKPSEVQTLAGMLETMQRQNMDMMRSLISEMRQPPVSQQPVIDPFAMFEKALGFASALIKPQTPDFNGMIELFTKGMAIGRESNAGPDEGGAFGLIGKALENLPAIVEMVKGGQPATMPQQTGYVANPVPNNYQPAPQAIPQQSPQPSQQPQPTGNPQQDAAAMISAKIDALIPKAQRGTDPTLIAEYLEEELQAENPLALQILVTVPDVLEQLAVIKPVIRQFMPWFTAVLASLREGVQYEPEEHAPAQPHAGNPSPIPRTDPGRTGGDQNDTQPHAGVGPRV